MSLSCSWCSLCAVSECCSSSRRLSGSLAAGVPGLPAGSARARLHRRLAAAPARRAGERRPGGGGRGRRVRLRSGRGGRCARPGRPRGELAGRGGGQIRCLSLLVGRVACHGPDRTSSPSSAQSRAPALHSPASEGGRSAVPGLGPGPSCPGTRGASRSCRRCPLPRLGRAVCLASAASSAPTQRGGQALRFASLRESCRTRA